MTFNKFRTIIKFRSVWRIDARMGNYRLPSGDPLGDYVYRLVKEQCELDKITLGKDGATIVNYWSLPDGVMHLYRPYTGEYDEYIDGDEYEKRLEKLTRKVIFG